MQILNYILAAMAAYFIGSFSASIFLSETLLGRDVRQEGSGNAGATNMARAYGMGLGVMTLLCDFAKALLAVWLCRRMLGDWGLFVGGFACLVGHCFPLYYQFKGGKGISTGAALGLCMDWRMLVVMVLSFAIAAGLSRKVSVGSICAAACVVPAAFIMGFEPPALLLSVCAAALVLWRHRENMRRIIKGTEPDFKAGKDKLREITHEAHEK